MNSVQLNKTLRLIKRTGDKAIVLDQDSDQVFVLMDLDDYEDILDYCDDDAIPTDPSSDRPCEYTEDEHEDEDDEFDDFILDDLLAREEKKNSDSPVASIVDPIAEIFLPEEEYNLAPELLAEIKKEDEKKSSVISVPVSSVEETSSGPIRILNEESLSNIPSETEEEKFYLEPVE